MTFAKGHKGFPRKPTTKPVEAGPELGQFKLVLDQLTSVVTRISEQNEAIKARLAVVENATPQFVPIEHERQAVVIDVDPKAMKSSHPYMSTKQLLTDPPVETTALRGSIPVGTDGVDLSDEFILRFPPQFRVGSRVRVNPDARIHIGEDAEGNPVYRTRGEEYRKGRKRIETVGEVLRLQRFSTPHKSWKYSVRFPGITRYNGAGYYEKELLPA